MTKDAITNNSIINRHKARLLKNLEDAQCPKVYLEAVISGLNWLRSDITNNDRHGEKYDERHEDPAMPERNY